MALLAWALLLGDAHLEAIEAALRATGEAPYRYEVRGRFDRGGQWQPPDVLSSRMKTYQSARRGDLMLVKGAEGLWKTAEERLGEKVERPDPEAADIVRTLQGAEAPHRLLAALLAEVDKGREPDEREVDGVPCLRYVLYYRSSALRTSIEKNLERAIERRTLARPDEVRWASSMKGGLRIYVHKAEKRLLKAVDDRSVKLAYKVPDGQPEIRSYRTEMEITVADWGKAALDLPPEVRDRLGLK
jgi:hypothetical protein